MTAAEAFLLQVLDEVERREARLLAWGLADQCLSDEELRDLIDPLLDRALADGLDAFMGAGEVVRALEERALLFPAEDAPYAGHRSRMAETVRQLSRLRQLFPKHEGPTAWQQARTLVAGFRFARRPRRYPRRDLGVDAALRRLEGATQDPVTTAALAALLAERGDGFGMAGFQLRATERLLSGLEARRTFGTLVSAGTGSGKTLAFYLPALARIATGLVRAPGAAPWVKALAIYPRTELLRDQFAETYREARRLDGLLRQRGAPRIRIGALFGGTPRRAADLAAAWSPWRESAGGRVCGVMGCPAESCVGDLVWPRADAERGRERLVCAACGMEIHGDEVALTRESMARRPPDILFTTTEMLNQRMSDSRLRGLFGLPPDAARAPEMLLLDEVHAYAGPHGAQVAYLLRRWAHLVDAPVGFVGLSATLRDGARFFGRLAGLEESAVEEIAPRPAEMTEEGAEYLLALRGDPVSRASLLSTTIQTSMLVSRALDPPTGGRSGGVHGHRLFIFTDDLDVNNRLYFGLLDAEGRKDDGNPDFHRHQHGGLARLRQPLPVPARERHGQNWGMAERIGHDLTTRQRIGRTNAQDPGVAAGMDVIVATASLEVGFNDPGVGAVIQHKAPRGVAPFLQRKGRAGRQRRMRPWTIVVLSDYGRDRLAYHAHERLFDPELSVQALPLASRYIQRIQTVYALIDDLGRPDGSGQETRPWQDLAEPGDARPGAEPWLAARSRRQARLAARLLRLLEEPEAADDLAQRLARALHLPPEDVLPLLWEAPRPLLTAAVPTALRRLRSGWRRGLERGRDLLVPNAPLPDFVPANLFSDLMLPEVRIHLPTAPGARGDVPTMPAAQAIRTFAPGRVSRRFGTWEATTRHWVAPGLDSDEIELKTFFDGPWLGEWPAEEAGATAVVPVLRPFAISPAVPPKQVRDTSNARIIWRGRILATAPGNAFPPPAAGPWGRLVERMEAFLHGEQAPVEVRRFAIGSEADLQLVGQDAPLRRRYRFVHHGRPAAVGFSMSVDALRFRLALPEALWRAGDAATWRALRTARFQDLAASAEALPAVPSPFVRRWLATVAFAALGYVALRDGGTVEEAVHALAEGRAGMGLAEVLDALFQSPLAEEAEAGAGATDRLRAELDALLRDPPVLDSLFGAARVLWEPVDAVWEPWLRARFRATVAAAIREAIRSLCPDIDEAGLLVDVDAGAAAEGEEDDPDAVWITEATPGGTGLVEAFLRAYAEDPRRFYALVSGALEAGEYELTDHQLRRVLGLLARDDAPDDLLSAAQAVRRPDGLEATWEGLARLRQALARHGFVPFHGFVAALCSRVLRPGATDEGDRFLHGLLDAWETEEARLGIELDQTVLAYARSHDDALDQVLEAGGMVPPADDRPAWRFGVVSGLLWPRGAVTRNAALAAYNPFAVLPEPERLLVAAHLAEAGPRIDLLDPSWQDAALTALGAAGAATLLCPASRGDQLAEALAFLATEPAPSDYLVVHARLVALRRVGDGLEATFEVPEAAQ